jgi:hypothetical protein
VSVIASSRIGAAGGDEELCGRDIRLEFAVAPNTSETADDVLDPYLLVAVLLSDEFFAPGGR